MHLYRLYTVVEFQNPSYSAFWDINFYQVWQIDRRTESDAYELTVHGHMWAQKGYAEQTK